MVKQFNDMEFKLYGRIQSFFYRCWVMFGAGRELEGEEPRAVNKELVTKWAHDLFPNTTGNGFFVENWQIIFPNDNHNVIELVVHPSRVSNWEVFTVDLNENLEDYDFYNIKWVYNIGQVGESLDERPTHTYKAVPKVF